MSPSRRQVALVLAALLALTVVAFRPVGKAGFVSDDDLYVKENPAVLAGLSASGALRAWTTPVAANWHPLTMLSLMADAELFGPGPAGFHLMNVVYHLLGAVFCFLALRQLTGALWRSAAAAAVFAVHPLHVESVAWISERKDVLSGLLFWLALGAYAHHARRPSPGRHALVTGLFTAGLLAKPMLVTLPLLLLVLDFWPLARLRAGAGSLRPLLREKVSWLALSAAFSAIALLAQARGDALQTLENVPLAWRVKNMFLSYAGYLGSALWPEGLHHLHPYPNEAPAAAPALAALALIAALTALAAALLRRYPALGAGWFWYLGMLVPVIGLVQVGSQTSADRYMYLPLAGVTLALVWPLADLLRARRALRVLGAAAAVAAVGALALASRGQARHWESGFTLYRRSLEVGRENEKWLAHYGMGVTLSEAGEKLRAAEQYRTAIGLRPNFPGSHNNYAAILLKAGRPAEALVHFGEAARLAPADSRGHYGVGLALAALGRDQEALRAYQTALGLKPENTGAYTDLGAAFARLGRYPEAERAFREALRLRPEDPLPPYNLGLTLAASGRQEEAIEAFKVVLHLRPDFADAYNDLGVAYAAEGEAELAVDAFEQALKIQPGLAAARANLARARGGSPGRP